MEMKEIKGFDVMVLVVQRRQKEQPLYLNYVMMAHVIKAIFKNRILVIFPLFDQKSFSTLVVPADDSFVSVLVISQPFPDKGCTKTLSCSAGIRFKSGQLLKSSLSYSLYSAIRRPRQMNNNYLQQHGYNYHITLSLFY